MQTAEEFLFHAHELGIREKVIQNAFKIKESEYNTIDEKIEAAYYLTLKELKMEIFENQICNWNSSLIKSTEYNPVQQKLVIQFSNDKKYEYENFAPSSYREFLNSESKGKHFLTKIKKEYTNFKKVETI